MRMICATFTTTRNPTTHSGGTSAVAGRAVRRRSVAALIAVNESTTGSSQMNGTLVSRPRAARPTATAR